MSDLTNSIAQTILDTGRAKAQGIQQQGQIWGNFATQLGQIPGQVMGQMRQAKAFEQEEALNAQHLQQGQMQIEAQERAAKINEDVNGLIQHSMEKDQNGVTTYNRAWLQNLFTQHGTPLEAQTRAFGLIDGANESTGKYVTARNEAIANYADQVMKAGGTPEALTLALAMAKANYFTEKELQPMVDLAAKGGDLKPVLQQIRDTYAPGKYKPDEYTLGPGGKRFQGDKVIAENPVVRTPSPVAPPPLGSEGDYLTRYAKAQGKSVDDLTPQDLVTARSQYGKEATPRQAPAVGSFEDFLARKYGPTPTPAQILEARKGYGQADDRPRVNVSVNDGSLTPDAVNYTATAYRLLGTRAIPTRISGAERIKILNEAAQQAKTLGQSPAVAVTRQLTTKADSAALTQIQKMSSSAEAYESKAIAQADLIEDLSSKVPRTNFPIINAALQSGRTNITGNENATKLANAVTTFAAEYAKIMEGSTGSAAGSSDSSRAAAGRLINAAMSKGTMAGVLDLMKKEMRLTLQGYDVAKEHITDRLGGAPADAAPSTPKATHRFNPATGKIEEIK